MHFARQAPGSIFWAVRTHRQILKQRSGAHLWQIIPLSSNGIQKAGVDSETRARARARDMLSRYEAPPLDEGIDDALRAFIAKRSEELPDTEF